jgi:hypothetical protein
MRLWGLRPIVFGPGTLWRSWGTRPVPIAAAMTQTPAGLSFDWSSHADSEARAYPGGVQRRRLRLLLFRSWLITVA